MAEFNTPKTLLHSQKLVKRDRYVLLELEAKYSIRLRLTAVFVRLTATVATVRLTAV